MLVTVYEVAGDGTLSKKLILNEVVDYHYKEWFYKIGNFELTVLASDPGLPYKVYPGDILYVYDEEGGDDSLYVTTVSVEKGRIKFEGYDLKILLNFRTTLFPTEALEAGTYGYDVRQGYTGDIIKGYIDYNLCEAEDPNRQIPNCYCTTDSSLGISDDTYMSRLQPLNEVVEDLCKNAGIGYKVTLDTYSNYIIINIFGGRDKHAGIGFGTYIGNADSVKKIRDNSSQRSDVWAVNGTNADDSTVTNVQLNNSTESGIRRKETVITLNCETELVEEFAKHSSVDFKETDEIDASVSVTGFENKVGDYVVVYDDIGGYNEMRINAIEKEYSGAKLRKKLHFVDYQTPTPKEKTLEKLSSETNTNQKDIIDQKLDGGGSGIANAVIVAEKDVTHLLHEYTTITYVPGSHKIGYAGPTSKIVCQGYVFDSVTPDNYTIGADILYGTALDIRLAASASDVPASADVHIDVDYDVSYPDRANCYLVCSAVNYRSAVGYYYDGVFGIYFKWDSIHAPNDNFPYGYIKGKAMMPGKASTSATNFYNAAQLAFVAYFPFATEAEYNAAVGLTYEPLTLTEVQETTTEV